MVKRLIVFILLVMINLTGCSSNQTSKISKDAKNTVERVSIIYGEQTPKIADIKTTEEETTKKPMYIVFLEGNFQKGNHKSKKLEFSMTEDGKKVWSLTSDSWQENEVNVIN